MRGLLTAAALAAGVVAVLEAILVIGLGWHLPSWALVVIPCVAALAAFLTAGRLRAIRRQRRRRARTTQHHGHGERERVVREIDPSGARELEFIPVHAEDGGYQR
jgi:membrane protein implicated in regulation of membrane protease activity